MILEDLISLVRKTVEKMILTLYQEAQSEIRSII